MVKVLNEKERNALREKYSLAYIQGHVSKATSTKNLLDTSYKFADEMLDARDELPKIAVKQYYKTENPERSKSVGRTVLIGIILVLVLLGAKDVVLFVLEAINKYVTLAQ